MANLAQHPDQLYVKILANITIFGAKIGYCGPEQFILSENLTSANEAPEVLIKDLEEQQSCNRLIAIESLSNKCISSPLGLVPKADGRWRRIQQGPNAILVKKDLADAFRHIPVATSDH